MSQDLPRLSLATAESLIQSYVLGKRQLWSVLKASGTGLRDYLQGQITQDINRLTADQGIHACILTPQGKAISELYILEGRKDELILLTPSQLAEDTVARLRRFALGYELRIGVVDGLGICSVQGANAAEGLESFGLAEPGQGWLASSRHEQDEIMALTMPNDPRGFWVIASNARIDAALSSAGADNGVAGIVDEDEIEAMRIIQGIPRFGVEWQADLHPLNANLSEFDGVSFDKGCYVGQEVTSRMHWRGGIKKKLYKVRVDIEQSDISPSGESAAMPWPLTAKPQSPKLGELRSVAFDHEGKLHGIALLPIEVAESARPLCTQAGTNEPGATVQIEEACHA